MRVVPSNRLTGVDEVTIKKFDGDLKENLYKLWNRMSSGSYSPPSVRRVEIEKENGGKRILGVPCVSDLDIRAFFDNLDHKLMMRAVRKHTDCKWILLYVERWLKAPMQTETGELTNINREKGTAQGSVVSPLLSNLFLHYALDLWLSKNYSNNPFERYARRYNSALHK